MAQSEELKVSLNGSLNLLEQFKDELNNDQECRLFDIAGQIIQNGR